MRTAESEIRFNCPQCKQDTTDIIRIPTLNWGSQEHTVTGIADVNCEHCENSFAVSVVNSSLSCVVTFEDYPFHEIEAEHAIFSDEPDDWGEYDDWADYNTPKHPSDVFTNTYEQVLAFLEKPHKLNDKAFINKMIFIQLWSALESFLCDSLVNEVIPNTETMLRLLDQDKNMLKEKVKLSDIVRNKQFVEDRVKKYLTEVLYHNLEKVNYLYQSCLSINIYQNESHRVDLLKAVTIRHHCVHRNGKDTNGNELRNFDDKYIRKIAKIMSDFVAHIQRELNKKGSAPLF